MSEGQAKYEGWSNYETWLVKLWLDNDASLYEEYRDVAKAIVRRYETIGLSLSATGDMAQWLKEYTEEYLEVDDAKPGLGRDLMLSALQEVDFHEIAESILEEVQADFQREAA